MTYIEWKQELSDHLISLTKEEREKVFAYYAEMYADKRDAGISDKEIILGFGAPYDVAKRILNENYDENLDNNANLNDIQNNSTNKRANPYSKKGEYGKNLKSQTSPPLKNNKPQKKGSAGKIVALVLAIAFGALILCGSGCAILAIVFKPEFSIKEYRSSNTENISALYIESLPGNIKTEFYDGDEIIIEYPWAERIGYEVSVKQETIKLTADDYFLWFGFWDIPDTVIKIPTGCVLDIVAEIDAGSFSLASGEYKNINLDLDAGKFELGEIVCWSMDCSLDAGAANIKSLICTNAKIDLDAGESNIDYIDCDTLLVDLDAGSVNIKKATVNHINANVDAGSLNIKMTGFDDEYTIRRDVSAGSFNLSAQTGTTDKTIIVDVSAGSVNIQFPINQSETVKSFGD